MKFANQTDDKSNSVKYMKYKQSSVSKRNEPQENSVECLSDLHKDSESETFAPKCKSYGRG